MTPARISLFAACLAALAVPVFAQDDAKTPAPYASDPKYTTAFNEARAYRQDGQAQLARDGFVKANKIAGGICVPCLNRVYELDMELRDYKHAIATAQQLIPLSPTPKEKSVNEGRQGDAMLQAAGEKVKPEQLEAVHAVMQAALADHPKNQKALWDDAFVLARMNKTDEAKEEFARYVERAAPNDPKRVRAAHFAENPELAKLKMAPPFEVKTLDGTVFNLDEMGGKVVLLDFWATWCGPCQESLPELRHLAKEFAGQPFVLLSISGDDDGAKWREFVAKNQMTWLQYRDRDDHVSKLFDAHLIPHYFIIDSDGVLTTESVADNTAIEGKIKKLIKRANESAAAAAAQSAGAGTK
jgi:thiol-disulfide isomerase/thioredoxin